MSDDAESKMNTRLQSDELVWSNSERGSEESSLDFETATSLRCHLHDDFQNAEDWSQLVESLCKKGFYLNFDEGRLILINAHTDVQLCTCQYLGFPFSELAQVLGKPHVLAPMGRVISRPRWISKEPMQ